MHDGLRSACPADAGRTDRALEMSPMLRQTLFVFCALIALVAVPTHATAMVYTATVTDDRENWGYRFSIPKFDPSLGTLASVRVDMTTSGSVSFTAVNDSSDPRLFWASYEYLLNAQIGSLPPYEFRDLNGGFGLRTPRTLTIGANATETYGPIATTLYYSPFYVYSQPEDLARFSGPGMLDIPISVMARMGLSIDSPFVRATDLEISTTVQLQVSYRYNAAVPEPSSLALAGLGGAVWLGGAARRRWRRSLEHTTCG